MLVIIVVVALGIFVVGRAAHLSSKIFVGQKNTFWSSFGSLFGGSSNNFTTSDNGQVNVLLLGIGGEGHDGPYLSDTMILAQLRPATGEVVLTSIPRDYWVPMPNNLGFDKINAAFSDGYLKNHDWNEGGDYARQVAEHVSGLDIPYFAVIDFSGFEKAINQVGGVNVTVDRSFTDYQYPDSGTGYLPPQTFQAGPQHMDGARALIFARSRHAAGDEGSDFARGQRQQKIIAAFEAKVFTSNLIKDAGTINSLLGIFADHFHTNLTPSQLYQLYGIEKSKQSNILSLSLDPDTGLICPEIAADNGAYILTPCPDKSEEDVQNFFKNAFDVGKLAAEKSVVWLANSTDNQLAYDTAFRKLTDAGLQVYQLSYTKDNLPSTIVYQATTKPATVEFIENVLNATQATLPPPGVHADPSKVDVIVVLGANAPAEPAPKLYIPPPARIDTSTPDTASSTATTTKSTISTSTKPTTATTTKSSTKIK